METTPPPFSNQCEGEYRIGFTLIELSIVLVIIGLIIGGILVGRDLINSAQIRAQIKQIDELELAVNTFKIKYGSLPGDMPPSQAAQLGFFTFTGTYAGLATRVGCLSFFGFSFGNNDGYINFSESTPLFQHLAEARLLGSTNAILNSNTSTACSSTAGNVTSGALNLPRPKISPQNGFLQIIGNLPVVPNMRTRYYNTTKNNNIRIAGGGLWFNPYIFYSIDNKIDDSLPTSGKVRLTDTVRFDVPPATIGFDGSFQEYPPCTTTGANPIQYNLTETELSCSGLDILF